MSRDLPRSGLLEAGLHLYPVRVYYEDTDAAGLVYYANYFRFAERARTELLRVLGFGQEAMREATGLVLVVRGCAADYRAPARLDDDLVVATRLVHAGAASLELAQEVRRDGRLLVALDFRIACVAHDGRPQRLPAALRAVLDAFPRTGAPKARRLPTSRMVAAHAR